MQNNSLGHDRLIRKARLLHCVDKPHQLFGGMGQGHIIVFALSPFFGEVGGKGRVPEADIFSGIVEGVAQIA